MLFMLYIVAKSFWIFQLMLEAMKYIKIKSMLKLFKSSLHGFRMQFIGLYKYWGIKKTYIIDTKKFDKSKKVI